MTHWTSTDRAGQTCTISDPERCTRQAAWTLRDPQDGKAVEHVCPGHRQSTVLYPDGTTAQRAPQPGDLATLLYPQDLYPLIVTRVSPSGRTMWVDRVVVREAVIGHAYMNGPWPVYDHTYTEQEVEDAGRLGYEQRFTRSEQDGLWYGPGGRRGGARIALGAARYRRDFSL